MDIRELREYLLKHRFKKFVLEKEGVLKTTFKSSVVFLQPAAFCLSNDNGDFLCVENIKNIEVKENDWGTEFVINRKGSLSPVNLWCV